MNKDGVIAGTIIFICLALFIGYLLGALLFKTINTPHGTFKAVCRVEGGVPYESVQFKNVCIKGGQIIPVTQ